MHCVGGTYTSSVDLLLLPTIHTVSRYTLDLNPSRGLQDPFPWLVAGVENLVRDFHAERF